MQDLARFKYLQQKMAFVASEMVNILQNISQERTDKKITKNDIAYAMRAAYMSLFPGDTLNGKINDPISTPLGYYPYMHIVYVKGMASGKASGKWVLRMWTTWNQYNSTTGIAETNLGYSTGTVAASSFWPTLTVSEGNYKVIIQCAVYYDRTGKYNETFFAGPFKGKKCGQVSTRQAFGFHIINPKGVGNTYQNGFFPVTVIFTPKPGLFSETVPQ